MTVRKGRRPILIISGGTILLAAVGTALAALGGVAGFTGSSGIAQSIISVGVPFVTGILGARCRGVPPLTVARLLPTVIAFAVGMAAVGIVITALVTAAGGGSWELAGPAVAGSVIAQTVAGLIGLGLGTLIGRPVIADLLTIIIPLGLLQLLRLVAPAAAPWLTPFPNASRWWSGTMGPDDLPPFLIMVLIWVIGLNTAGWLVQARRTPVSRQSRSEAQGSNEGSAGPSADRR